MSEGAASGGGGEGAEVPIFMKEGALEDEASFLACLEEMRHYIHAHPEVGFKEVRTQALLRANIVSLGIPESSIRVLARTGLVVRVEGEGSEEGEGRVVALRSDIDALPMTEENEGLAYRSVDPCAAHMCGHDGHMTVLFGTLCRVWAARGRLPRGNAVVFLFQPAEEGTAEGGGAEVMVREGALDGVDEVYGFHNRPNFAFGDLHVIPGPTMAAVTDVDIVVRGKGVHAAQPHGGNDVVLAASSIVVALQSVVSRCVHYGDAAVLSISKFHAGQVRNVLPSSAALSGTIRTLNAATLDTVCHKVEEVATGIAKGMGCTATVAIKKQYPALVNHHAQVQVIKAAASPVLGEEHVRADKLPVMGGEDFAFYTQEKPGAYFFLGGGQESRLHTPTFDFRDKLIPNAIQIYLNILKITTKLNPSKE